MEGSNSGDVNLNQEGGTGREFRGQTREERIQRYLTEEPTMCRLTYRQGGYLLCGMVIIVLFAVYFHFEDTESAPTGDKLHMSLGTSLWPDSACNYKTPFGACNTADQTAGDRWAKSICQLNGYASGRWTGKVEPGCTGDAAMYCGDESPTCSLNYRFACRENEQSSVEILCKLEDDGNEAEKGHTRAASKPVPHPAAPRTLKPTPKPVAKQTLQPTPGPHAPVAKETLQPTPGPHVPAVKETLQPTPGPHMPVVKETLQPTPGPHMPVVAELTHQPEPPAATKVLTPLRVKLGAWVDPRSCPGDAKAMLVEGNGAPACVVGGKKFVASGIAKNQEKQWCIYATVVNDASHPTYRLEVIFDHIKTRRGLSRVYVQKDSQVGQFGSGTEPPARDDSSIVLQTGSSATLCVRWAAEEVLPDETEEISFTMGIYKDIGDWKGSGCRGNRYSHDKWWDGQCGVLYEAFEESCPREPNDDERCGEYKFDKMCRVSTCGNRTLEDNNNKGTKPQFFDGYGMEDPEDPNLYKVSYSKRSKFDIEEMISKLEEVKSGLEKKWEPWGGEMCFDYAFNENPHQEESETRLGTKFVRAMLLGDVFTVGFTGSSNTAGHHNMFYNTYPLQLQAMMTKLVTKIGYRGAAFRSKNYAWGGGLNTWTEAWCVSAMTGDDVDVVTWESYMNDGGRPDPEICEVHLRNALQQEKRPVYHIIHAGKDCDATKWWKDKFRDPPWRTLNEHYHAAGAGMMEIWPCHGAWKLAQEKGENHNSPRWLYVTWHPGPLGHRQYAEIQMWNYMKSGLAVLKKLKQRIINSAPDGVPTEALKEVLKEPRREELPSPLHCGDICSGLKRPTTCLTSLKPANPENTIQSHLSETCKWQHMDGFAWDANKKALDAKQGGMNSNDQKFKWAGKKKSVDGIFELEVVVPYKYIMFLRYYGWSDNHQLQVPRPEWEIRVNGVKKHCITTEESSSFIVSSKNMGNSKTPEDSWGGCLVEAGPGVHNVQVWHDSDTHSIYFDNIIGV